MLKMTDLIKLLKDSGKQFVAHEHEALLVFKILRIKEVR